MATLPADAGGQRCNRQPFTYSTGNHIPPSLASPRLGKQSTQLSINTQEDNEDERRAGITLNDFGGQLDEAAW